MKISYKYTGKGQRTYNMALVEVGNGQGQNVGPGRQLLRTLGKFKPSQLALAKRDRLRYKNTKGFDTIICRVNGVGQVLPNLEVT